MAARAAHHRSGVGRRAARRDRRLALSLAFLVLLESLSPVERAVFLLRDVFGYGYGEIARVVDKSEENCRQIAVRARRQVDAKKPRFEASRQRKEELARRFFAAAAEGDVDGLFGLLAADVVAYGDGGGKAPAFPRPVFGRDRVARLLASFRARAERRAEGVRTIPSGHDRPRAARSPPPSRRSGTLRPNAGSGC